MSKVEPTTTCDECGKRHTLKGGQVYIDTQQFNRKSYFCSAKCSDAYWRKLREHHTRGTEQDS